MARKKFKTNWKYIFILIILFFCFFGFFYWQLKIWPKEEFFELEIKRPKKFGITEELVRKIIDKILPENYDRKTACFFIDDLNGDGVFEIIIGITPNLPANEAYLAILEPKDEIGNYKKIADFKFSEREKISFRETPCIREVKDLLDIDGDGKKEMILSLGTGGATNEAFGIFKIDWDLKKIKWLKIRTKQGNLENSFFLKGGGIFHQEVFYLKDIDGDEILEVVEKFGQCEKECQKEKNWQWQISVYKWNGKIFEYSQKLSEKLLEK